MWWMKWKKLSVHPVSTRGLTFPFIFIGVVAANKSINDAIITTELGEWRVAEVPEQHTLAKWPFLPHLRYVAFRTRQSRWRCRLFPHTHKKKTLLSFRSCCGCYVSLRSLWLPSERPAELKTVWEICRVHTHKKKTLLDWNFLNLFKSSGLVKCSSGIHSYIFK